MSAISVRRLTARDLFRVVSIMSRCIQDGRNLLGGLGPELTPEGFAYACVVALLRGAETEIRPWLADLAGMEVAQFDQLPFEAPLVVIDALAAQEDLPGFFASASRIAQHLVPRAGGARST